MQVRLEFSVFTTDLKRKQIVSLWNHMPGRREPQLAAQYFSHLYIDLPTVQSQKTQKESQLEKENLELFLLHGENNANTDLLLLSSLLSADGC